MPNDNSFVLTSSALLSELETIYSVHQQEPSLDGWVAYSTDRNNIWVKEGGCPDQFPLETDDLKVIVIDEDYKKLIPWSVKGYRTVWLNRSGALLSTPMPKHDLEVNRIDRLEEVKKINQTPKLLQCLAWWDEWEMPDNVRRHVSKVAWSAYTLAAMLRFKGEQVDPILTHRGGLLHDLDKIQTLRMVDGHGKMGAEFLEVQGYPEIAEIVRGHLMHTILDQQFNGRSWAMKLVFFCDKLTEGDDLVTLEERFTALGQRYPAYKKKMDMARNDVWRLNDEICSLLGISDNRSLVRILNERYSDIVHE